MLVSSHLMSELQDTADQLIVIGRGRLVADTTVADLLASASKDQVEVVTDAAGRGDDRPGQRRGDRHRARRRRGRRRGPARRRASRRCSRAAGRGVRPSCAATGPRWRRRTWSSPAARSSSPRDRGGRPMNAAARRVDQAPLGAPLGRHPARRRRADRRPERARRVRQQHRHQRAPQLRHRPGRRPRGRRLRLRPPDRHRRHVGHRAGHVAGARRTLRPSGGGPDRGTAVPPTPWTDIAAGITLKDGTEPGSSYVSVLLTGSNGVRMQSDFTHDVAGSASSGDRWLRLTRTGDEVTGYESADGTTWQQIATMTPTAVPGDRRDRPGRVVGPHRLRRPRGMGGSSLGGHPESAVATFDDVALTPPSDAALAGHRRRECRSRTTCSNDARAGDPQASTRPRRHRSATAPTRSSARARSARRRRTTTWSRARSSASSPG